MKKISSEIRPSRSRRVAGSVRAPGFSCALLLAGVLLGSSSAAEQAPRSGDADPLFQALGEELQRSMTLRLEDLDRPYFIQYAVDDTRVERVAASYGALTQNTPSHSRTLFTHLRTGSMELDNANFVGGRASFGRRGAADLPLEDDVTALRQVIWRATDGDYKSAVETLTQKRSYLKERSLPDRPHDFTPTPAVTSLSARAALVFDRPKWEEYARRVSAAFARHRHIDSSEVRIVAGVENRYLVNSEGTRIRQGTTEATLRVWAEAQAADGERMSEELEFGGRSADQLPPMEQVLAEVSKMAARLQEATAAPILDDYTGPVLIDGAAAPQLFRQLLARGIAGRPEPVGSQRRAAASGENLENRLGKRVLPTTFQVYADPRVEKFQGTFLAGHYLHDDEGVPAQRVEIVVGGKLTGMLMSRTPTKKFSSSNGHGRRSSSELPRASLSNLFIESSDAKSPEDLKKALLKAADDEGLPFGLRIEALQGRDSGDTARLRRGGSGRSIGDPVRVFKVFVADGREELVRGCEFRGLDERVLRRILASGNKPNIDNRLITSAPSSSLIAPAVLLDEVELTKIERESERKPYLPSPQARAAR
jgi:TldD protein